MNAAGASATLQAAIHDYFHGEHSEMLAILAWAALLAGLAIWLWLATRTGFSLAFMATVVVSASLLAATAGTLLVRDKGLAASLAQSVASDRKVRALAQERERVEAVVAKYRYYRYGAAALGALGILGLLLIQRGWAHGVSAALLLLVVAQVVIDHFSESRALQYLGQLSVSAAPG